MKEKNVMDRGMEKEDLPMQTAEYMMVTGTKIKCMAKVD